MLIKLSVLVLVFSVSIIGFNNLDEKTYKLPFNVKTPKLFGDIQLQTTLAEKINKNWFFGIKEVE